jgi:clan AA aspartic protease (TIGR02281 family)
VLQAVTTAQPGPSRASTPAPPVLTIETTRRGRHHILRAAVIGRGSKPLVIPFLVDTGASTMALPASLMAKLGYDPADLEDWLVDTANGQIQVKKGRLASVELGGPDGSDILRNVDVVFIDDAALNHPLLGMNVLGRYRVTIDDDRNQITLVRKR